MKKLFVVFTLILAGCVSAGINFDDAKLNLVQKGQTTKQDVIGYFGNPTASTVDSEGNEVMAWSYSTGSVLGANAKVLQVKMHDGKVESYSVSQSKI